MTPADGDAVLVRSAEAALKASPSTSASTTTSCRPDITRRRQGMKTRTLLIALWWMAVACTPQVSTPVDTEVEDTDGDTIVVDTVEVDTEVMDTEVVDTILVDTIVVDTEPVDTIVVDTERVDTIVVDTELVDSDSDPLDSDTQLVDTDVPPPDTMPTDTDDPADTLADTEDPGDTLVDTEDTSPLDSATDSGACSDSGTDTGIRGNCLLNGVCRGTLDDFRDCRNGCPTYTDYWAEVSECDGAYWVGRETCTTAGGEVYDVVFYGGDVGAAVYFNASGELVAVDEGSDSNEFCGGRRFDRWLGPIIRCEQTQRVSYQTCFDTGWGETGNETGETGGSSGETGSDSDTDPLPTDSDTDAQP